MTHRKLSVIMLTDIVGHTSLKGADEVKAFEVLRRNREINARFIAKFHST